MKIRIRAAALLAVLLCMTMAFSSCAASLPAPQLTGEYSQKEETERKEAAFITIDINPSIELTVDKNHTVTSVGAANADAEVMLWDETELVGSDLNTALAQITALAVEMGYLTEDNADISVTVTTETGETEDALLASIDEALVENIKESGIEARVEEAVDLVMSKELERVKKENEGKPGYDDTLTLSRFRLVQSALRADRELTMDEAVLMTNDKLTETVKNAQKVADAKLGEVYEAASSEAQFVYENAKQTMLDSAYTAVYTSRRNLSALLANYGAAYSGYRLAYRTIEHYANTLKKMIDNPTFTSDDVFALANALGIDTSLEAEYDAFKAEITDENGEITKDSVNAYVNRVYKNMDEADRAKLDAAYDSVLDIFDRMGLEASVVTDEGKLLIQTAMFGLGLSFSVETYEDIPALLDAIQKKIDDIYAKMEADMTENEKAKVIDLQEDMSAKIAEYEKAYQESLAKAKSEAEAYMNSAKEENKKQAEAVIKERAKSPTQKAETEETKNQQTPDKKNEKDSRENNKENNKDKNKGKGK